VGRVDRDLTIFYKKISTIPIAVRGSTHTAGHKPRKYSEVECGERVIVRLPKDFKRAGNSPFLLFGEAFEPGP
jgi:hypothetical protein